MLQRVGWALNNWGRLAGFGAKTAWGNPVGRGALIGAGAGGLWGAVSDDTSVLGGMVMGAGLGAAGARYGGAGFRKAATRWNTAAGQFAAGAYGTAGMTLASNAGRGAWGALRSDVKRAYRGVTGANYGGMFDKAKGFVGTTLRGNKAVNPISGLRGTPAADLRRTVMAGGGASPPGRATAEALRRSPRTQQDLRLKMVEDIMAARAARVGAAGRGGPRGSLTPGMSSAEFAGAMGSFRG